MSFARPAGLQVRAVAPSEPSTIVLVLGGPLAPADVAGLCERAHALLERSGAALVVCDVGALGRADALAVDAVARLQLTARRLGRRIRLRRASPELQELLAFAGLSDVVPSGNGATPRGGEADRRGGTGSPCPGRR